MQQTRYNMQVMTLIYFWRQSKSWCKKLLISMKKIKILCQLFLLKWKFYVTQFTASLRDSYLINVKKSFHDNFFIFSLNKIWNAWMKFMYVLSKCFESWKVFQQNESIIVLHSTNFVKFQLETSFIFWHNKKQFQFVNLMLALIPFITT